MQTDTANAGEVTVTEAAEKFIRRMVRFGGQGESAGFRLVVTPGGCSGLSSEFSVEKDPRAGDVELVIRGMRLFLPAETRARLEGVTIDFADTRASTGLSFIDPKAGSCGCSTSSGPVKVELGSLPQ